MLGISAGLVERVFCLLDIYRFLLRWGDRLRILIINWLWIGHVWDFLSILRLQFHQCVLAYPWNWINILDSAWLLQKLFHPTDHFIKETAWLIKVNHFFSGMHITIYHFRVDLQIYITAVRIVFFMDCAICFIVGLFDHLLNLRRVNNTVIDCHYRLAPLIPGVDLWKNTNYFRWRDGCLGQKTVLLGHTCELKKNL